MVKFIPLTGFLLIAIGRIFLPQPPNFFYISIVELVGLVILLAGLGFKLYHRQDLPRIGNVITAAILIGIALVSWWVAYPDNKTIAQAESYNQGIDSALTEIIETRRPANVRKFVPDSNREVEEKLDQAVTLVRRGEVRTAQELIEEINPKIEVFVGRWNCVDAGCTFGTDTHVWTLNPVQYYVGWAIGTISLFIALIELRLISLKREDWTFKRNNKK